jgi:DNA protecting protein DprA
VKPARSNDTIAKKRPEKRATRANKAATAALPGFPLSDGFEREEAERDASALLPLFHFRRWLDHQALSLIVRSVRPLSDFWSMNERELKALFARFYDLRGYVNAWTLATNDQHAAAHKYAERMKQRLASGRSQGSLLLHTHPDFPHSLKASRLEVQWLFCHSRIARPFPRPIVAIIGSRRSNPAQLRVAAALAEGVGAMRGTVVTGLATGADGAAHEAATDTEATLVAVLGGGIAKVYPAGHERFVNDLTRGRGTVLTELPPDYSPNADAFVWRNRIVAGLADYVIAVSGDYASGTAHTIRFAADARVPVLSADPTPQSGISRLVRELGGDVLPDERALMFLNANALRDESD